MRIDGVRIPCTRANIRKLRHERPIWGTQTVIHSNGRKLGGIRLDGSCRAAEPGHADGRFPFLSLLALDKEFRKQLVIAYRYSNLAKISARKLP